MRSTLFFEEVYVSVVKLPPSRKLVPIVNQTNFVDAVCRGSSFFSVEFVIVFSCDKRKVQLCSSTVINKITVTVYCIFMPKTGLLFYVNRLAFVRLTFTRR